MKWCRAALVIMMSLGFLLRTVGCIYDENSENEVLDVDVGELPSNSMDPVNIFSKLARKEMVKFPSFPEFKRHFIVRADPTLLYVLPRLQRTLKGKSEPEPKIRPYMIKRTGSAGGGKIADVTSHNGDNGAKPSLSIMGPLEALQRKVSTVINLRQKDRNRQFLESIGKRSYDHQPSIRSNEQLSIDDDPSEENDDKNNAEITCCPPLLRTKYIFDK